MSQVKQRIPLTRIFLFVLFFLFPAAGFGQNPSLLWLCDQAAKRVVLVSPAADWNQPAAIRWEWSAKDAEKIPVSQKHLFDYLSDARLVNGGKELLVAGGSGGGVALIRIADKKVLFFDRAGKSPHSAERLPDGNLAVVSSQDNRLRLYFPAPRFNRSRDFAVPSPHGLVWDSRRTGLWVLGLDSLYFFAYKNTPTFLRLRKRFSLPSAHGHDLFPRAKKKTLLVTTKSGVYEFFPRSGRFRPFGPLKNQAETKSVCENPKTGQLVFVRAVTKWWNDTVEFRRPRGQKTLKGARFYKARWNAVFRF